MTVLFTSASLRSEVALMARSVAAPGSPMPCVMCGEIVNYRPEELPPPGVGFATETCALPAIAKSEAAIVAVSWDALANDVARLLPFQRTLEVETKPEPVIVRVKSPAPTSALV